MNENVLTCITQNLIGAWYLDLKFLVNLLDEHKIDFDNVMDSIEDNFWKDIKLEFNTIVYEVLNTVASKFIEKNPELFTNHDDEFEIYTNFMDSHIYFTDEDVQSEFERFY